MKPILVSESYQAPVDRVFAAFTDFANAADRIPDIKKVEVLTPGPVGVGTRFRETRVMLGKEATEEMLVSAYEPNRMIELSASSCGSQFRMTFHVTPTADGARLDGAIHARAVSLMAKIMAPLLGWMMSGMMKKCVQKDLAHLKASLQKEQATV